ncbi:hypothetical protein CHRY9293_03574 [Chryseobacterium potabilaquae]|uniref:Uncharacterized protein n=2 Tax=Chryseobacterium potabilaquae TaxID=2675057 RepID=A0A6N4XCM8_9FLAO|nr:hypothetical protein CHRY9293_03574 [Chryseobacterium potabilaquae]
MTSASFRGKAKETPINSTAIENILLEIPDVNPIWLLTGEGEMLKELNTLNKVADPISKEIFFTDLPLEKKIDVLYDQNLKLIENNSNTFIDEKIGNVLAHLYAQSSLQDKSILFIQKVIKRQEDLIKNQDKKIEEILTILKEKIAIN